MEIIGGKSNERRGRGVGVRFPRKFKKRKGKGREKTVMIMYANIKIGWESRLYRVSDGTYYYYPLPLKK